jgi:hypothetical protein
VKEKKVEEEVIYEQHFQWWVWKLFRVDSGPVHPFGHHRGYRK